jgi:hypothetical protein
VRPSRRPARDMGQIFHPSFNTISKVTIFGAVFFVAGALWLFATINRSDYVTGVDVVRAQPIPFSHRHHAGNLGLDCRYCHWPAEEGPVAAVPPTEVCMGCHSQIWNDSPMLEPVRASLREGRPLRWTRVHALPEFVAFDHSIHVSRGIACESCHGRVDEMPLTRQVATLQMEWCLDCHRHPEREIRPPEQVFTMGYAPSPTDPSGPDLVRARGIPARGLDDCSICHQ